MTRDLDLIRERRVQYESAGLDIGDVAADPLEQWMRWHADALAAGVAEPNAMVVATVDAAGFPSVRTVLVRGVDSAGLTFFTNYDSPKSRDLMVNPRVAAVFVWLDLHRQVRLSGTAARISAAESDAYFASRPRGSQIGAWASPQSHVIDRADLDARVAHFAAEFGDEEPIPRPTNWGGWRIVPTEFEFWQGRENRLHDRLRYRPGDAAGTWAIERLAP